MPGLSKTVYGPFHKDIKFLVLPCGTIGLYSQTQSPTWNSSATPCDVVWHPTNVTQTSQLERFHSKCTSFCDDASISSEFLFERCKFHTILQTYKILHQLTPTYLHNIFAVNVTGRVSRNSHCLFVPQLRTNYGKCSLYYRGTVLWNALSAVLYDKTTVTQFRSSYLESLRTNCR